MKVSIILPTYNERETLPIIVNKISQILKGKDYEIIIVDDNSPDKTFKVAENLSTNNKSVRIIHRTNISGLSSAIVTGFASAKGEYLIVMDADLQHDPIILPDFIKAFEKGKKLIIGTRKSKGGKIENWSIIRKIISSTATLLSKLVLKISISDPMSGFFGITKSHFEALHNSINPKGFKILLEFILKTNSSLVEEIGYIFQPRLYGKSKLNRTVATEYIISLLELRLHRAFSIHFIKYAIVGSLGVFVNLFVQFIIEKFVQVNTVNTINKRYITVICSIEVSLLFNFFLNHYWTFKEQSNKKQFSLLKSLALFHAFCLIGAFINYTIYIFLFEKVNLNIYISNLIGIIVATLWNYTMNKQYTWKINF